MSTSVAAQNTPAPYGNAHGNVRVEAPSPIHRSGSGYTGSASGDHHDRPSPAPRQSSKSNFAAQEPQTEDVDPRDKPLPHDDSSASSAQGAAPAMSVQSVKSAPFARSTQSNGPEETESQQPVNRINSEKRMAEGEGHEQPQEEEQGAARGEGEGAREQPEGGAPGQDYPEQLHAGKLDGLGPEYDKIHKTTMSDRFKGFKEQIKGTVKRDPELKQRGKERMTGELKKEQQKEMEETDPFGDAEEKKGERSGSEPQNPAQKKTESGLTDVPASHPTDKGAAEQASSVKPEGHEPTTKEKEAHSTASDAQLSSSK